MDVQAITAAAPVLTEKSTSCGPVCPGGSSMFDTPQSICPTFVFQILQYRVLLFIQFFPSTSAFFSVTRCPKVASLLSENF